MNLVSLANFVKSGWILLKLNGSYKLVKYKVTQSEAMIKIVEIMITIDIHVFYLIFTKFV